MRYPRFPLMIDLEGKKVLVIGGGHVASRRAETLLRCGAVVVAVSPDFLEFFPVKGVTRLTREFAISDVTREFAMVIAACDKREVNHSACLAARSLGIPVNVCDSQSECDFFFPALVNCGSVAVSVNSGGLSSAVTHRLACRLRKVWSSWVREESCNDAQSTPTGQ